MNLQILYPGNFRRSTLYESVKIPSVYPSEKWVQRNRTYWI